MCCLCGSQDFVERLSQYVDGRGLKQDATDADRRGLLLVVGANVAGGEDDRNVGADGQELAGYLETGDPRHGEVGDDSCEAIRIRAKFSDGSHGVDVTCDVVAEPFEVESAERDQSLFVVDEEYVFVMDGAGSNLRDRRSGVGS